MNHIEFCITIWMQLLSERPHLRTNQTWIERIQNWIYPSLKYQTFRKLEKNEMAFFFLQTFYKVLWVRHVFRAIIANFWNLVCKRRWNNNNNNKKFYFFFTSLNNLYVYSYVIFLCVNNMHFFFSFNFLKRNTLKNTEVLHSANFPEWLSYFYENPFCNFNLLPQIL